MELNNRMVYILSEMLSAEGGIRISDVLKALSISKRTFYYNFDKIGQWLLPDQLGTVHMHEGICTLETDRPEVLRGMLQNVDTQYFVSAEERQALELFYMVLSPETVSIETFQRMFDVSKNTILADIKRQKELLHPFDIEVQYSPKNGYSVEGEEFAIRRLLGSSLNLIEQLQVQEHLNRLLDSALQKALPKGSGLRQLVGDAVSIYEAEVGTVLVQSFVENAALLICIAYIRCACGRHFDIGVQEKETLGNLPAFQGVGKLAAFLDESAGFDLCEGERYYIAILLLGVKNFDFNTKTEESSYIWEITERFIDQVERNANITIKDKESLKSRLAAHIGPMYYRLKYGLRQVNPLLEDIRTMYKNAFMVTEKSIREVDPDVAGLVNDDEIGYLAMYIGGELSSRGREAKVDQNGNQSVLIVCGAGVATSVLVRNQLIDMIGDRFHFVLCPAGRVKEKNLRDYVLIVSTVRYEELPEKTVYVGAVLSERDKKKIIGELNQSPIGVGKEFKLKEVMDLISKYQISSSELERMNFELYQFFHQNLAYQNEEEEE